MPSVRAVELFLKESPDQNGFTLPIPRANGCDNYFRCNSRAARVRVNASEIYFESVILSPVRDMSQWSWRAARLAGTCAHFWFLSIANNSDVSNLRNIYLQPN